MDHSNRKLPRHPEFDYNTPGMYFLTICTENRRCILSDVSAYGSKQSPVIKLTKYGHTAKKYIEQLSAFYSELSVENYVIMPNHIHILLNVQPNGPSGTPVPTVQNSIVSRFVSTFKRFSNKEYGENIWQSRSYDHIIRDQEDYLRHLEYINDNPFKWESDKLYSAE